MMEKEELIKYIQEESSKGVDSTVIKNNLLKQGYSFSVILSALNAINNLAPKPKSTETITRPPMENQQQPVAENQQTEQKQSAPENDMESPFASRENVNPVQPQRTKIPPIPTSAAPDPSNKTSEEKLEQPESAAFHAIMSDNKKDDDVTFNKEKKKHFPLKFLLIIILAIIIVGGGVYAFTSFFGNSDENVLENPTPDENTEINDNNEPIDQNQEETEPIIEDDVTIPDENETISEEDMIKSDIESNMIQLSSIAELMYEQYNGYHKFSCHPTYLKYDTEGYGLTDVCSSIEAIVGEAPAIWSNEGGYCGYVKINEDTYYCIDSAGQAEETSLSPQEGDYCTSFSNMQCPV